MTKSLYLALGLAGALGTNGCYTEERTVFHPTGTRIDLVLCVGRIEERVQITYLAGFEIQQEVVSLKELGKVYHPNNPLSRQRYEYCTRVDEIDPGMGVSW